MGDAQLRGTGTVSINHAGPHAVIQTNVSDMPGSLGDRVTEDMYKWINRLDETADLELSAGHIKQGETLASFEWSPVEPSQQYNHQKYTLTIDWPDSIERRWYREEPRKVGTDELYRDR